MTVGAPGRTRTGSLLFRRCLGLGPERIGDQVGLQRLRQSMRRPTMRMAVARRRGAAELPVVGPPGVGRFDDPARPEAQRLTLDIGQLGAAALDLELVDADGKGPVAYRRRVVAGVEVQHTDVINKPGSR